MWVCAHSEARQGKPCMHVAKAVTRWRGRDSEVRLGRGQWAQPVIVRAKGVAEVVAFGKALPLGYAAHARALAQQDET